MSKGLIQTHAGDDSDGKIWGIEGLNILFMLAGLLIGVGLALLLSRHNAPALSVGAGTVPFALVTTYVFAFRQGKPRAFDTDWLESQASGSGWMSSSRQPRNPLLPHASTQRLVH
jgi:hypothetical protein